MGLVVAAAAAVLGVAGLSQGAGDEGTPAAGVVLPERKGARPAPTREELEGILESTGGNVVRTADALQTSARQLYRWLERYDLDLEKYRNK